MIAWCPIIGSDSPEAVRAGQAKGKLIFQFEVGADHPLARVGKAALRQALGIEIFYGHGDPTILGAHPDGPELSTCSLMVPWVRRPTG